MLRSTSSWVIPVETQPSRSDSDAIAPVSGASPLVCYRYDQDELGFGLVNHGEREAWEEHSPSIFSSHVGHAGFRGGGDEFKDTFGFRKEVLAKTGGLRLVELRGIKEFSSRAGGRKAYGLTAAAGVPARRQAPRSPRPG